MRRYRNRVRHPVLNSIIELRNYVDYWGELQPGITEADLNKRINEAVDAFRTVPEYRDRRFDANTTGLANFERMRKLTKNCTN